MTTDTNTAQSLSLTDVDGVLPPEFKLLSPDDPRSEMPLALRAVRDETTARTHYFYTPLEYLKFVTSVSPRRVLAEEYATRYVLLSSQFDADPYFHASITQTIAAFTRSDVVLHRFKSDETAVRFELSLDEMTALVSYYQSYLEDRGRAEAQASSNLDPFLNFPDDHS